MANNVYAHTKEAVRVKVKKCELNCPPEWRKFSVDPQITSLEVLYSLLAKAFDIKSDFSIKYKAFDPAGNEIYLAVLSDWDLDAAFLRIHNLSLQTATEPCLTLQIDIKPFTEVREWDADTSALPRVIAASTASRELMTPLQQSLGASQKYVQSMQTKLPGLIMNQMEKTFSIVQKAFNLSDETMASLPPRAPLSDAEFRLFLDSLGQIQRCDELRKVIFLGGIDPGLRRVVWKHILNVYPGGMTGKQRMDYMKSKSEHYCRLRDTWKLAVKQGHIVGELSYVTSMVKKDVLRTDRLHPFYAGSDDNQNIASLFNILTTYALNHPTVSYCQGMSDIASPLLVTMNDEAQAYICFCAIMARLRANFMLDGIAMTQKFAHLTEALGFYDPEFWEYLKSQQADDLLFCYRWLLLELKREFPFEDALRMLEVQWSSLKYDSNSDQVLPLYEKEFVPIGSEGSASTITSSGDPMLPHSPSCFQVKPRENPYTKVCALRRQSSSTSLSSLCSSFGTSCNTLNSVQLDSTKRLNQSLDDNITRHAARRKRHASNKAHQSLDESKILSFVEGVEAIAGKDEQRLQTSEATVKINANNDHDDDDGDEVFEKAEQKMCQHFHFHPTNPFIEDAQKSFPTSPHTKDSQNKCSSICNNAFLSPITTPTNDDDDDRDDRQQMNTADKQLEEILNAKIIKSTSGPKSFIRLQNRNISHCNAVNSFIVKQVENASVESRLVEDSVAKKISSSGGGHFKELKEKIAATSKRGLILDDIRTSAEKPQQKLVKNFNEFLSFASLNKSRVSDKLSVNSSTISTKSTMRPFHEKSTTPSPTSAAAQSNNYMIEMSLSPVLHPVVRFPKSGGVSSFDDSDSSSIPETTGSCSTAATAIQQSNNLSNYSLHLAEEEGDGVIGGEHNLHSNSTKVTTSPPSTFDDDSNEFDKKPLSRIECPNDASVTPDDGPDQDYYPMSTAITRELRLEADNLDRQVFGDSPNVVGFRSSIIEYEKLNKESLDLVDDLKEDEIIRCPDVGELIVRQRRECFRQRRQSPAEDSAVYKERRQDCEERFDATGSNKSIINNDSNKTNISVTPSTVASMSASLDGLRLNPFVDESMLLSTKPAPLLHNNVSGSSSLPEVIVPTETATDMPNSQTQSLADTPIEMATNASEELTFATNANVLETALKTFQHNDSNTLPPPSEFGGGNPFLIFLCLTLLLQHRNTIIKSGMDYNEIAMHFDKMVRKHDVTRVLNQARRMYVDYLKAQTSYNPPRGHKYAAAPTESNKHNQNHQSIASSSLSTGAINES